MQFAEMKRTTNFFNICVYTVNVREAEGASSVRA